MDRLDVTRTSRVIVKRFAKLLDARGERGVRDHDLWPHLIQQFVFGDDFARSLGKRAQQYE
jgi:hypothetical protein